MEAIFNHRAGRWGCFAELFLGVNNLVILSLQESKIPSYILYRWLYIFLFECRQGLSYKLRANHLADYTADEMRMLRGKIHDPQLKYNGGQPFSYTPQQLGGTYWILLFLLLFAASFYSLLVADAFRLLLFLLLVFSVAFFAGNFCCCFFAVSFCCQLLLVAAICCQLLLYVAATFAYFWRLQFRSFLLFCCMMLFGLQNLLLLCLCDLQSLNVFCLVAPIVSCCLLLSAVVYVAAVVCGCLQLLLPLLF